MRPRRLLPALLLIAAASPAAVLADNPGIGQVLVPVDHVMPGQTFPVTGYDLDENSDLTIRIASGTTAIELGTGHVAADGTLATVTALPGSFPHGYAELTASAPGGGRWSTFVLVGPRAEGPEAVANAALNAQVLALLLGALVISIVVVVGWRHARR